MRVLKIFLLVLLVVLSVGLAYVEMRTSFFQAAFFSRICRGISFWVEPGPSHSIRFPQTGPYDLRLGYSRIPFWADLLDQNGYRIEQQARVSETFLTLVDWGLFPIYHEKTQAGLRILDSGDQEIFTTQYPQRLYPSFEDVPPLIVNTLLFIENRHLLDDKQTKLNPAIEWERLAKAFVDLTIGTFKTDHSVGGGSTLATQLEKYQHSPEGFTASVSEKLRQVVSASLRSYLDGENTYATRKKIFLKYINSIPLAAIPKFGEVNGLGDGLWAWFDTDVNQVNRLLFSYGSSGDRNGLPEAAAAFRKVLTLFLAHRQPSALLLKDRARLHQLTESYLKALAAAGIIPTEFRDAAMRAKPEFRKEMNFNYSFSFEKWKTTNLLRTRLLSNLKTDRFYDLDRYDLTVYSTLHTNLQEDFLKFFNAIKEPSYAMGAGFNAPNLLARGNPSGITYSVALYETTPQGNYMRVLTNSSSKPFNIDESAKVDLGSSAKLRTIVHYLEVIEQLHTRYGNLSPTELNACLKTNLDPLSRWAVLYLAGTYDRNLSVMLDASLERVYSASPYEQFFTGGGLHRFGNFSDKDDDRFHTLKTAFYNSVNLVFIRLMRDIVRYHIFQKIGCAPSQLETMNDQDIKKYLAKFADQEGSLFLARFHRKYRDKSAEEGLQALLKSIRRRPAGFAAVFRYLKPEAGLQEFSQWIMSQFPDSLLTEKTLIKFYETYDAEKMSLQDRGYIAHIHPLELWLVGYKKRFPGATYADMLKASEAERQAVYTWLFRTRYKSAKLKRIRVILELEAFQDIHQAWKRVGFPFDFLVPSYASSIGSSGDKPAALAELMGIIVNNGIRKPIVRFRKYHFGQGTPYDTTLNIESPHTEQVLSKEVTDITKQLLMGVVNEGTARSISNDFVLDDGTPLQVGGKTGTGDHQYKTFGAGGQMIGSKTVSRAATFVFFIGERHFGVVTAFVAGEEAAKYKFTSGLPVLILKNMWPSIKPFIAQQKTEPPQATAEVMELPGSP
ncbi:MAG: transglycosylase domain-containing protein [Thermodesulfobacteriota bacterium]